MKRFKKLFPYLFPLLFLVSCDPGIQITYSIKNATGKDIEIKYIQSKIGNSDTIEASIQPNQTKILKVINSLGTPETIDKYIDSITAFNYFVIQKDTLISTIDIRNRKEWTYYSTDKYSSTFKLTIDDNDF